MPDYELIFASDFFRDFNNSVHYYNGISVSVEEKFRDAINYQVKLLKSNPFLKSIRYDSIRFARIENFPYAIHYYVDESTLEVWILRLLADHQNPETSWLKKW